MSEENPLTTEPNSTSSAVNSPPVRVEPNWAISSIVASPMVALVRTNCRSRFGNACRKCASGRLCRCPARRNMYAPHREPRTATAGVQTHHCRVAAAEGTQYGEVGKQDVRRIRSDLRAREPLVHRRRAALILRRVITAPGCITRIAPERDFGCVFQKPAKAIQLIICKRVERVHNDGADAGAGMTKGIVEDRKQKTLSFRLPVREATTRFRPLWILSML